MPSPFNLRARLRAVIGRACAPEVITPDEQALDGRHPSISR